MHIYQHIAARILAPAQMRRFRRVLWQRRCRSDDFDALRVDYRFQMCFPFGHACLLLRRPRVCACSAARLLRSDCTGWASTAIIIARLRCAVHLLYFGCHSSVLL